MSIYKKTGALLFGTRLKRLSDKFFSDLAQIYKDEDIRFEPGWFPVFYLLDSHREVTISKIARQLEITHSGASQIVTALKKKGFTQIAQDSEDKRVKTVRLTDKGTEKLSEIRPVWQAIQESMLELSGADGTPSRVLNLLEELEDEMARVDLVHRVQNKLKFNRFLEKTRIIPYTQDYHDSFMALVLNWIAENPGTLPDNTTWINQTREAVHENRTAVISLAVHMDEIISACVATIQPDPPLAELTLILEKGRVSDHIVQALLDKTGLELGKKGINQVLTSIDTRNSSLLKLFQTNEFKLIEIDKGTETSCARLFRTLNKEK